MFQTVAAFGGGLWVQNKLSDLQLPQVSRAEEGEEFKISVRIVAASIPIATGGGMLTREKPKIAAIFGPVRKETEFGDEEDGAEKEEVLKGTDLPCCQWRFGETLTFTATVAEVLGGQSVQLWVLTNSDLQLGPWKVNLARTKELGVCTIDLKKSILPECVITSAPADGLGSRVGDTTARSSQPVWETPVLSFPLTFVGGSNSIDEFALGQVVGHVLVAFNVNLDPQAILKSTEEDKRPVADSFQQIFSAPVRWMQAATDAVGCHADPYCGVGVGGVRGNAMCVDGPGYHPDLPAEGWVKHKGPNGREFWHHLSLGPPPWRTQGYLPERNNSIHALVAGTEEDSMLKLPTRDQPMVRAGSRVMKLEMDQGTVAVQEAPHFNMRHSPMARNRPEAPSTEPNPEPPPGVPGGTVRRMSYGQASQQPTPAAAGHLSSSSSCNQSHFVGLPRTGTAGSSMGGSFINAGTSLNGEVQEIARRFDQGPVRGSFITLPASRSTFAQGEIFQTSRAVQPAKVTSSGILQGAHGQHVEQSPRTVKGTGLMSVASR